MVIHRSECQGVYATKTKVVRPTKGQPEKSQLLQQLQELDIDSMTPRDALDCLYELKKLSEKIES